MEWLKIAKVKEEQKQEYDRRAISLHEQAGKTIELLKSIQEVTVEAMVSRINRENKKNRMGAVMSVYGHNRAVRTFSKIEEVSRFMRRMGALIGEEQEVWK